MTTRAYQPSRPFWWVAEPAAGRLRQDPTSARILELWAVADGYNTRGVWATEQEYEWRHLQVRAQQLVGGLLDGFLTSEEVDSRWTRHLVSYLADQTSRERKGEPPLLPAFACGWLDGVRPPDWFNFYPTLEVTDLDDRHVRVAWRCDPGDRWPPDPSTVFERDELMEVRP